MSTISDVISLIEKLTGQKVPLPENKAMLKHDPFAGKEKAKDRQNPGSERKGIGYSQFNEMLLTLGYDRVTPAFFAYLFGKQSTVESYEQMVDGIDKFRKHAMLLYGNVKFGFKTLSCLDQPTLEKKLKPLLPIPVSAYKKRHAPLHDLEPIAAEETYYVAHLIQQDIEKKLKNDPDNSTFIAEKRKLGRIQSIGLKNHEAYLTYDHMDVYVATSMRQRHEFYNINIFVKELFKQEELKELKLRYFDPTQAYCPERLDKGLVEGFMLKRAKCTIYHAQETETLGKDSELAATLAQGKPVIAFVPKLEDRE